MAARRVAYDVCIIGGGPAGWAGAVRAWDLGLKVCLVERREGLGGAAVWGGAMGKHVMQEVRTLGQIGWMVEKIRREMISREIYLRREIRVAA